VCGTLKISTGMTNAIAREQADLKNFMFHNDHGVWVRFVYQSTSWQFLHHDKLSSFKI
jgi:hypothetical protein